MYINDDHYRKVKKGTQQEVRRFMKLAKNFVHICFLSYIGECVGDIQIMDRFGDRAIYEMISCKNVYFSITMAVPLCSSN